MTLARRDPRTADEALAGRIVAHFLRGEPFPEGEAGIRRGGHPRPPPAPYGLAWPLEPGERWLAHALGCTRVGLDARGNFARAGSAAVLVTDRALRLMLGCGGPERPEGALLPSRGQERAPAARLETRRVPYRAIEEVGSGDLLFLRAHGLPPLVLQVPWPRSLAALVAGLRGLERQPLPLP